MNTINIEIEKAVEGCRESIGMSIGGIRRFAKLYSASIRKWGEAAQDRFQAEFPYFGPREWRRFEMVASGELRAELIFRSDSFIGKLVRMKDSAGAQDRICMSSADGSKAISRKINKTRMGRPLPLWTIVTGRGEPKVRITRPCTLGMSELRKIVKELEKCS